MNTDDSLVKAKPRHCVMIPFLNRHEQVARCLDALLTQETENTFFLLIDDGSTPQALHSTILQPALCKNNVHLIHHKDNYGVAAARNSALHWCRKNNMDIVIMIDSDCLAEGNFISEHLRLHAQHPEAACIGGRIIGEGEGLWAQIDGTASWVHSSAHHSSSAGGAEFRKVEHPYHLATTNFSVKLAQLPEREQVFDERLISGEDCLLVRELRQQGRGVYFSSTPRIFHEDRQRATDVFRHHYEWGHHQYFIQLGGDLSPRCFALWYRALFSVCFLPLIPLFALAGAVLNCKALWQNQRDRLWTFPFIYVLWLGKGVAVLEAALRPQACLRRGRKVVEYELAVLN